MPIVPVSSVATRPLEWLWEDRILVGGLSLVQGDAGTRKSTLALNLAAKVTTGGRFFGTMIAKGAVLLLGDEDGFADTVRPRLEAMGADLALVFFFEDEAVSLAKDLSRIEEFVKENQVSLIVVDPLSAFLGVDSNHERGVRQILTRVVKIAQRNRVAVLGIRHPTKSWTSVNHSGAGSIAIGAVARSILVMAPNPADESQIVVAQLKPNAGPRVSSVMLRFEGVRAELIGQSPLSAIDILHPTIPNPNSLLGEAMAFLTDALSEGAVSYKRLSKLASCAGVANRTLRKAKDLLGVEAKKQTGVLRGSWYWRLPNDERFAPEGDPPYGGHLHEPEPGPWVEPVPAAPGPTFPPGTSPPPPAPALAQAPSGSGNQTLGTPKPEDDATTRRFRLLEID